jgi:predicted PurR-regulated permease PerM
MLLSSHRKNRTRVPMPVQINLVPPLTVDELPSATPSSPDPRLKHAPDSQDLPSNATVIEEAEVLHASIRAGSIAQIVVAAIAVIGLLYLLKLVMVTTLVAILLAFVFEPLVGWFARIRVPRPAGALIAVALMVCLAGNLTYFFYNRAVDFAIQLPQYSGKIHDTLADFRAQTTKLEESTRSVLASPRAGKQPLPVEAQEAPGLSRVISASTGTLGEVLLAISFIPFLIYFMLTWKDHMLAATVRLFPKEYRLVAHRTAGRISAMIRSFIIGNVFIGLVGAAVSTVVFWYVGIPYFYFLGVITGFASLIPYLGVFLAAASVGGRYWSRRPNRCGDNSHFGHWLAFDYDERSLPQNRREAAAVKSTRGDSLFVLLGVDLGSDGADTRGTFGGSNQNRLRLRRFASRTGRMAGRVSTSAWSNKQLFLS